ncbi:PREDICTED: peroxisomal (S)-2-hydroxy-acid oxidase GLO4-like [Nelumbo nucifera]|uniref:Peroxisomal (S)-2-hydroxy-acid oxidase GLO4-like n=1 Tax=Nelumbo nucifera TaxID=4432 RepID=A0A1U8B463_NELNU|nr:PREDICTED: peroxisomal (S)-2-hydroxy-acid oxidase GLO4-like [Nelumbo nucifera]
MEQEPVNVSEFQKLAKQILPKMYYDFITGGADDEYTLRENIEAFRRITFRPRVLVDVSRINLSTTILGHKISVPIMLAPTARHKIAHPEGEVATARAAAACNTIMVLSFTSNCTLEEVASSCDAVRFFQLYVLKRRDVSAHLVQRAESNGYKAIVLTADRPRLGQREADIKNRLLLPKVKIYEGLISTKSHSGKGSDLESIASGIMDASFTWKVLTIIQCIV